MSLPLPLSNILSVATFVSPAAAPTPSFNQALIVGDSTVIPSVGANSRTRLYQSLSAIASDGFSTSSAEYLAAEQYFGQTPQPLNLWLGRRDQTAINTAIIHTGAAGTGYAVGDVVTVVQGGASGGQLQITTVSSGVVTGFQIISTARGTGYSVASALSTTGGTGTGLEVDITVIGETPLMAVQACRLTNPQWYCCEFVGTAVDSDHISIAGAIEAFTPASTYFITSGETAVLNAAANNLFASLQALKYRRTFSVYSTTQGGNFPNNAYSAAAVMGVAMGRNTGAPGSYFDIMFKPIAGVAPEPLTESQVNAICGTIDRTSVGLCGNLITLYQGNYTWTQLAVMASGDFFDEVLNLDMLAADIQNSGVALLTSVPALPITEGGMTSMKATVAGACDRAQLRGFIAPSGVWLGVTIGAGNGAIVNGQALPHGYEMYSQPVSQMSQTQRASRVLPQLTVVLVEAQSGHMLSVTVQVQK